jgi:hypothetical protein
MSPAGAAAMEDPKPTPGELTVFSLRRRDDRGLTSRNDASRAEMPRRRGEAWRGAVPRSASFTGTNGAPASFIIRPRP